MKLIPIFYLLLAPVMEDYKQYFKKGLAAYDKEDYFTAIDNFSKSYALKQHSKTSYYMAISYFKMADDSLANKFASRAQAEAPTLPDDPYQLNIHRIYEYSQLPPVFKKVRFKIVQSDDRMTAVEKEEQKKAEEELRMYYPNTPEGRTKLFDDFMFFQSRSLINEKELQLNMATGQSYRDPTIDSL